MNSVQSQTYREHNAKRCAAPIRNRIVAKLANGDSKRKIARELNVSFNTVTAVEERDWEQVETRKTRIAAQCERIATRAWEQLDERLDSNNLTANQLVPIAGVATDKFLALRGDHLLTIRHEHELNHHIDLFTAYNKTLDLLPTENEGVESSQPQTATPTLLPDSSTVPRSEESPSQMDLQSQKENPKNG